MRLVAALAAFAALTLVPVDDRLEALLRRVADLPRAEEPWSGRWEDPAAWPEARRRAYGECLRLDTRDHDLVGAFGGLVALLEEEPDLPPALHQLGVVSFRLRRYGDGVAAFGRFLAQAPEHVGRTRALGHCLYGLGRYGEAVAHYARVLAERPGDVEARFGRALALHRAGDLEASLAALDDVLERDPEHADAAYWRARLRFDEELEDDEMTLAAAQRAAALARFDPRPAHLVAEILVALGRSEDAAQARDHAAELARVGQQRRALDERLLVDPTDLPSLEARAAAAQSVGDKDAARADLRRASRIALARGDVQLAQLFADAAERLR